ncbi:MAG: hypothetical protein E7609_05870 [Ruminococcaceae bacterium]|nr:hypothetical protein [Oscillospiraceae bacterium]
MKKKDPPRKRILGKSRRFFLVFCVGALLISSCLAVMLACTSDISFELDEALFKQAGADSTTRLYYYDGDRAVEWAEERVASGGRCVHSSIKALPAYVKDAFVAMEDHRFYRHAGVDVLRTAKAAVNRVFGGKSSFGGSTITQQLIKNIGGEREKTVVRKVREMTRARMLEFRHTKDEILEAYLNIVPMAEGCVGVGAAAENYFGKSVSELTLPEAASLAAITPAPARLNPRSAPEAHTARRNIVLSRMAQLGYISEEECKEAQAAPLILAPHTEDKGEAHSWYAEHVLAEVKEGLLAKGYTESAANALIRGGGLRIYTALDPRAQKAAEKAFSDGALRERYGDGFHAGTALFSPETGKLVALVGDLGEKKGSLLFSYATDMRRAPGSTLKPLSLYAPAINEGRINEATLFDDVPQSFSDTGVWPRNTPDAYDGLILAKDALIKSKNTVAVAIFRLLGTENVYKTLSEDFRLSSLCRRSTDAEGEVRTDLAEAPLALGQLTNGVSLFEMTRAYLPFCREGRMSEGSAIFRVENASGDLLFLGDDKEESVLSPMTASIVTHMLTGVTEEGSAKSLQLSSVVDTAGKTGSSGGNRDRWFIGYTPYYLCGAWCGYEKGEVAVSGTPHLALFDAVMQPLHESLSDDSLRHFAMEEGLHEVTVCKDSGETPTILCKEDARGERTTTVWLPYDVHLKSCDTHVSVFYDEENEGVAFPPAKGREGSLKRVSLISVPWRAFPREVTVKDAEYVYREPIGTEAPKGDLPFFAAAIPEGVYIGKSHGGRPYNAAARSPTVPPFLSDAEVERAPRVPEPLPKRRLPTLPKRRLPRLPFFGF